MVAGNASSHAIFYVIGNSSKKASETSNKKGIPITKKDTLIFCRKATWSGL